MLHSIFRKCLIVSMSMIGIANVQGYGMEGVQPAQTQSDEEAFLIRRIAEFWKDGDFAIVKTQIVDFLGKYPKSNLKDYFLGILGDIYLQDNDYEKALTTYQSIVDSSVKEKTIINKLQCLYELDQYAELTQEGRPYLSSKSDEIQDRKEELYFLMGESLFRRALDEEHIETRLELAREAEGYYDQLPSGRYTEVSEFALAEIAAMLGKYETGAKAYAALAEKHPDMREDLLFQVASLEAKFNRAGAAETFRKVKEIDGKRASEATFNLIVLLFQNDEFEEVIESYEKIAANVPEEYVATFNFIVGKSFFSLGDYQNAIDPLNRYINSTYIPSDQLKNALLIQMTCAHQTGDEKLFGSAFDTLDTLFPNDQEIPKALFMHAMILKEQGAISKADEKLKFIKDNYTDFDDQESFMFEYGLLAHQNEKWQESYEAFKSYVADYSDSSRIDAAWKLFLSSSINLYKHSDPQDSYNKESFFSDLQKILDHSSFLTQSEMKDYSLLYAKTAYELDDYSAALHCLQDHIFTKFNEEEDRAALAEAHFIAGLCHAETQSDHSAFCMHLEQAMALSPDLYDSAPTHLQLYNAYISLAGYGEGGSVPKDGEQQQEFVHHAAEHLQEAVSKGGLEIKEENRLWLANHYFQKVKGCQDAVCINQEAPYPEVDSAIDHATFHYQAVLLPEGKLISIDAENLHLENEIIKLSKLLEYQNAQGKKLELIKALLQQQSEKPALNWTSQKEALYELALAYETLGEKEKAFETFNFIHASASQFPSSLANHAALEAARLHFSLLEKSLRNETNEEVLVILNDLKELQIRKNPASEPTHLEAALEYATIRSELSSPENQDERYLFFLSRIVDDFNSKEDIVTQDYLVNLSKDEEKKQVFDAYMKFIEAEKVRLEAKRFYKEEKLGDMEELHETALELYGELKNDPNTPRDLYERVSRSVSVINALNAY